MRKLVQVARPHDLDEITALVHPFDGQIGYVAGGTDLIIALESRSWPHLVIDVTQIAELDYVQVEKNAICIGAATTMATLAEHVAIQTTLPALAQAAAMVGSVQIRNRATIGGNVASAVPAGDLLPALKCLNARIAILRRDGRNETLDFDDVVVGRSETSLQNGDLITAICLPVDRDKNQISAFAKIGPREVLTIARLNIAIRADFICESGHLADVRIVAGAIAPKPLRLHSVEEVMRHRPLDQSLADDFVTSLSDAVNAAIPGRHSRSYKRRAIIGLGHDLIQDLANRQFDPPALAGKWV